MFTITREHVEQMIDTMEQDKLTMGTCYYSSPCIIGSVLPQETLDEINSFGEDGTAFEVILGERFDVADNVDSDYLRDAQWQFDMSDKEKTIEYLRQAIS